MFKWIIQNFKLGIEWAVPLWPQNLIQVCLVYLCVPDFGSLC